eukprot:407445-Pyramimonas_sp.AAC.1
MDLHDAGVGLLRLVDLDGAVLEEEAERQLAHALLRGGHFAHLLLKVCVEPQHLTYRRTQNTQPPLQILHKRGLLYFIYFIRG